MMWWMLRRCRQWRRDSLSGLSGGPYTDQVQWWVRWVLDLDLVRDRWCQCRFPTMGVHP